MTSLMDHCTGDVAICRKYIQLLVQGRQGLELELSEHSLTVDSKDVELVPMNKTGQTMVSTLCSVNQFIDWPFQLPMLC